MAIEAGYMVPHPPLIIPEVGRGEEKRIGATIGAYQKIADEIAQIKPETVILISPHSIMYRDYFHISPGVRAYGDMGGFGAPQVSREVVYDQELAREIERLASLEGFPAGTKGERDPRLDHGTMVPLYFVSQEWQNYMLVRIGLSGLSLKVHFMLGRYIRQAVDKIGRRAVLIASGDLSHRLRKEGPYGFCEEGPEYDQKIMEVIGSGTFERLLEFDEDFLERAGECGHRSFAILAGALEGLDIVPEKLSYEGPFGVGYGVCSFCGRAKDPYVALARKSLETYIRTGEAMEVPEGLPEEMLKNRAGTFVSLKEGGRLRGCIGTIQGVQTCIAREIIENAISAGVHDPRFPPVMEEELGNLTYSVDVLEEPEEIDSPKFLDVKRYGVIVSKGFRRGLLLPNLEGVDTVEEQIAIARQKAGIREDEEVKLERFEVVRHK